MFSCSRRRIAAVLTLVYLIVTFGPFLPCALNAGTMAHRLTGTCAGDCAICGCDPEKSAAGTCCCKRSQAARQLRMHHICKNDCCADKDATVRVTIISCGCHPGGSDNLLPADWGDNEQLPVQTAAITPAYHELHHTGQLCLAISDLHTPPPEPPPELNLRS